MCETISFFFFFSSRRRHTRYWRDWSSDVCSSSETPASRAISLHRRGPFASCSGTPISTTVPSAWLIHFPITIWKRTSYERDEQARLARFVAIDLLGHYAAWILTVWLVKGKAG